MTKAPVIPCLMVLLAVVSACSPKRKEDGKPAASAAGQAVLLSVGAVSVNQADLEYHLKESNSGPNRQPHRDEALDALGSRARLVQAAIDAGLLEDPSVRAEFSRVLASRLKERDLSPRLRSIADAEIPEVRLREIYTEKLSTYKSNEKRQAAVLWLNPGKDPERANQYLKKLKEAREWFLQNKDLQLHPEQGFSVLAVDYTEHQPSRFKNGEVGWLERDSNQDAWNKAVAEILFALPAAGAVSEVLERPEGLFLVRYMATKPASTRSFESVKDELARAEKLRLREAAEAEFEASLVARYPVNRITP